MMTRRQILKALAAAVAAAVVPVPAMVAVEQKWTRVVSDHSGHVNHGVWIDNERR